MAKSEVFILSEQHMENGSEKLSAYATESELIAAVQKLEELPAKNPVEFAEAIAEARKENGRFGVKASNARGWGGSHFFILSY